MKIRLNDRISARQLRQQGLSFSEIMEKIPNLSKGTLNGWLKDIELTEQQKERLLRKIEDGSKRGRLKGAFTNRKKRLEITKQIISLAKIEVQEKIKDTFFATGVMLYWAEGDKTIERVGFTNSDPFMISLMMKWFRNICNVPEEKFRIALSISAFNNKNESEKFWSQVAKLPLNQFNKTRIKPSPLKGKRKPSYMGTCRIIISDKNLFRKIKGWNLGILEYYKIFAPMAQWIEQVNSNH